MASDRFYIGYKDPNASLNTYFKPFALPDNAFAMLNNAYVFRGRVSKRFGTQLLNVNPLLSRLRVTFANTDGAGAYSGSILNSQGAIGQGFSVGNTYFTIYQFNGATPIAMLSTGAGTGTVAIAGGGGLTIALAGLPINTPIYYYPCNPVMGIAEYELGNIGYEPTYAFDTQFAYQFNSATGWDVLGSLATVWTGSNSQFFWSCSYRGVASSDIYLFVTNYNYAATVTGSNPIRYWTGTAVVPSWNNLSPLINATLTVYIMTCKIIVGFHNRLLLMNIVENAGAGGGNVNTLYANRIRYSVVGDPTAATAFYETPGYGGFVDAPTTEAIITAQFIKDRLIVYCNASTWELCYTGNNVEPFVFQQINTELGAESTFSQIPFDKFVLGVGNVGIHSCNGSNVERIDNQIPDEVFKFNGNSNSGANRICGIRDYKNEMVYWSVPSEEVDANKPFPNQILVYNYKTGSWALNDDTITAYGYFFPNTNLTWGAASMTWGEAEFTWGNPTPGIQVQSIMCGNQQGFTFEINSRLSRNASALSITNITVSGAAVTLTVINNNIVISDFILLENIIWSDGSQVLNGQIFPIYSVNGADTIIIPTNNVVTGTYRGGGTVATVSMVNIETKEYNFYAEQDRNFALTKVDFLVDATAAGQVQVDFYIASSLDNVVAQSTALMGTSVLDTSPYPLIPSEQNSVRLWHPLYFSAQGEYVQLNLYFNDTMMLNPNVSLADFTLHAMNFCCNPTSRLE